MSKRWVSILVSMLCAANAFADSAPSAAPRGGFSSELDRTVDIALAAIQQREQAQMIDGVRPVENIVLPGPNGRTALTYARETPDGRTWPLIILIPGQADGKSPSVGVEAVYDTIKAHKIGRMEWSDNGYYLAVLTQVSSLAGPGGDLIVAMPGNGHAKKIDGDVTSYAMSKDGRWLVYEKMKTTDDQTGPRLLMVSDGATGQRKQIAEISYPREQVSQIGVPDLESGKAKVTIRDYTTSLANPKDVEATVDLVGARLAR